MKKLIVKTKLTNRKDFDEKLASIGMEFSPVIWQHERVYLPADYKPHQNYPRLVMRTEVRKTDEPAQYFLYLKRHIEDSGVDFVHFTPVGDYMEAAGIVHQLGFRKAAEVSRQRQEVELDERTRLFLDVVEGIEGTFLKLEAELLEETPVQTLREDVQRTLELLGQTEYISETYAELLS